MRLITTGEIENWADTIECKYYLPQLIRKLIIATIDFNSIKHLQFSYGEDVNTGGYDGELLTESENLFVPFGETVWEFGTTNNKKGKADEDYEKRKLNPLDKIPSETTYVNINGKKYRDKKKWITEKKAESFWKDVRYLDAIDIDQWLELAPQVEIWLAEKLGKPTNGIFTAEEYWKRWSDNKEVKILPEIIAGESRKQEIEKVKQFLNSEYGVLYIKSITKDEALVFPLAILEQFDVSEKNDLSSRTLIIDNKESFNRIIQTSSPLIIITKFQADSTDISGAIHKGHKIIVPLSPSDEINADKIDLSIISSDDFENGLKKMGVDDEQARLLTKNSGRNISVLRRLLKLDNMQPKWLEKINATDIIPILLANRFSEYKNGDKEIIERISGTSFPEYEKFLKNLLNQEDTPIYHINGVWRLISPTDIWLYIAKYVSKDDFEKLQKICLDVLSEIAYKYSLPVAERGDFIQRPTTSSTFSSNLKEGLCETLAIISILGEKYGIDTILPDIFVDRIIQLILEKDTVVWRSLSSNLMILAEASPIVFLNNLERILKDKSALAFFEEQQGFLHTSNDLAPLLWCLNIIGWMPENLTRVTLTLCELINSSPDKFPTTNTPYDTIKSIYRVWYPQTNASAEDRKKILDVIIKKHPDISYNLLVSMVGSRNDTAFHTPRPKFRLFSELRKIKVTYNEISYLRRFCVDNIITLSLNNLNRTLNLIDLLDDIDWDKIEVTLNAIETGLTFDSESKNEVYQKFREFIGRHRSYPDADWSLNTEILDHIEETAVKFKTDDYILSEKYLFEHHHPTSIEGKLGNDYRKQEQEILEKRKIFLEKIILNYGIEKVFELADTVEHPHIYGNVLAMILEISSEDTFKIYQLIDSDNSKYISLANNFIWVSENRTSRKEQIIVLDKMIQSGISKNGVVKFLMSMRGNIDLWKYIQEEQNNEIESLYWKSQQSNLFPNSKEELMFSLDKLHKFKKSIVFLNTLATNINQYSEIKISSDELLILLEKVELIDFEDSSQFDSHSFENILEFLYSQNDYDEEQGAKIEMKFHFMFKSYHYLKPKNLYKIMSKNPSEYMAVVCQMYLPDDEKLRAEEIETRTKNQNSQLFFEFNYTLLESFDYIPSLKLDGTLIKEELNGWVNEVQNLAKDNYRAEITDRCIGKLLAKYPINISETKGYPIEIYDIIEDINSENINSAFEMQISNNLGSTTRGAFEGGNIERHKAKFFNTLFEDTKIIYPNVSLIFKNLREKYLREGNWEDENALLRSLS
ncbi:hypothetical protein SLW70_08150 [Flavobacterium sp. NG2]|uniref:hypothetical protein n=1 Tax=Flavobacterium sp. NG2 TaxID=3097547 RepID=UPI002A81BADB|nr:hypothetical protein [Flavobacterium sp. NG2]WPR73077.1 hypothetical protein SLW70_08150 [Flavobacterium sp. NG2]